MRTVCGSEFQTVGSENRKARIEKSVLTNGWSNNGVANTFRPDLYYVLLGHRVALAQFVGAGYATAGRQELRVPLPPVDHSTAVVVYTVNCCRVISSVIELTQSYVTARPCVRSQSAVQYRIA